MSHFFAGAGLSSDETAGAKNIIGMPIQPDLFLLPALLPEQEFLSAPVPAVYGPIEYREWESQLERIHEVPRLSGVEETFQRLSLAQRNRA